MGQSAREQAMIAETETKTHGPQQMKAQRWQSLAQDRCALCGMAVYAQIFIGLALYLYDHVSTPGYLSILLSIPFAVLVLFLTLKTAQTAGAEKRRSKLVSFLFALLHLFNAQLVFTSLCAILMNTMPDHSLWTMALLTALALAWANSGRREDALAHLTHFLKWLILILLGYAMVTALPHGSITYFFPVLGYGWKSIGKGTLWMCGAVSCCVWPLSTPQNRQALDPILAKKRTVIAPVILSILTGCATMLVSVWLIPFYAMARAETLGWRLMLTTNMTPSIPAWSMETLGVLLLFFLALSYHVTQAAALLTPEAAKPSGRMLLLLLLALVPCAACPFPEIRKTLSQIALCRGPVTLAVTLVFYCLSVIRRKKPIRKEGAVP